MLALLALAAPLGSASLALLIAAPCLPLRRLEVLRMPVALTFAALQLLLAIDANSLAPVIIPPPPGVLVLRLLRSVHTRAWWRQQLQCKSRRVLALHVYGASPLC